MGGERTLWERRGGATEGDDEEEVAGVGGGREK